MSGAHWCVHMVALDGAEKTAHRCVHRLALGVC